MGAHTQPGSFFLPTLNLAISQSRRNPFASSFLSCTCSPQKHISTIAIFSILLQKSEPISAIFEESSSMLLGGKKSFQKTHYDILSVKQDASYDEIRASYRAAILDSHPDKLRVQFETSDTEHGLRERFLQVQKAWEILGDSASRAAYDRELQASRQDFEVADDVKLEEMMVNDSGEFSGLFYQCRCGDYISIDSEELGEMGFFLETNGRKELQTISGMPASVVLPCGSCSLKIRLILDSNYR